MENLGVLSLKLFFFIITSLRKAKEGVCSTICLVLTIINSKMIPRELLGLPNLVRAQTLRIHKSTEVIMVGKYQNFVLAAFQIISPCLKSLNNYQKLTVMGFVPSLSRKHFSQKIGHWVLLALIGV